MATSDFAQLLIPEGIVALLDQGLRERKVIRITYYPNLANKSMSATKSPTIRDIEPYTLNIVTGKVFAYCRLRRDFRSFNLNRIVHIEKLEEDFVPRRTAIIDA